MTGRDALDATGRTSPASATACSAAMTASPPTGASLRTWQICPSLRGAARDNRAFLGRAVTWAARQGISQFPDLGTGMPALPSAGDAARSVIPGARTAYIDNDPLVISHARALLATSDGTPAAVADLAPRLRCSPTRACARSSTRPSRGASSSALVLSLMPARRAREVVAGYTDLVAPGSYVVISCGRCDDEALWKQLRGRTPPPASTTTRRATWKDSSPAWGSSHRASSRRGTGGAAGMTCPRRRPVRCTCWPGSRESRIQSAQRHGQITSLRQFARLVHRASWRRVPWSGTARAILGRAGGGNHELRAAAR